MGFWNRAPEAGAKVGELLLGRYEVESVLGSGNMGEVLKVRDLQSDKHFALKRVPPELCRQKSQMELIRANFKLVCDLSHANIVVTRFMERDPKTGDVYVLMDYVHGCDLAAWITRQRSNMGDLQAPLPIDVVLGIGEQIAAALDYAHSLPTSADGNGTPQRFGIVHRDLKPQNVMVEEGRWYRPGVPFVRIVDFGLAAEVQASFASQTMYRPGVNQIVGTPVYMAPEQWQGRRVTRAIDQWALAVMLYEMAEGRPPFFGLSFDDLREQVLSGETGAPDHLSETQSFALKTALNPDRHRRYASCMELVKSLAAADGHSSTSLARNSWAQTEAARLAAGSQEREITSHRSSEEREAVAHLSAVGNQESQERWSHSHVDTARDARETRLGSGRRRNRRSWQWWLNVALAMIAVAGGLLYWKPWHRPVAQSKPSQRIEVRKPVEVSEPTIVKESLPLRVAQILPASVRIGEKFALQIPAVDPNSSTATLSYELLPPSPSELLLDATTGVLSWTPAKETEAGEYKIMVEVTSSTEDLPAAVAELVLNVLPARRVPLKVFATEQVSVTAGERLEFQVRAIDPNPDASTLTYELVEPIPLGAGIDGKTGRVFWSPAKDFGDPFEIFHLKVSSTTEGLAPIMTKVVANVKAAPKLLPIRIAQPNPGKIRSIDDLTVKVEAIDPNAPGAELHFELLEPIPTNSVLDPKKGILQWTPPESFDSGTVQFTVSVKSSSNAPPATATFDVEVIPPTPLQVVQSEALTTTQGESLEFQVRAFDTNSPSAELKYVLVSPYYPQASIDANTGKITWNVPVDQTPGRHNINVRVSSSTPRIKTVTTTVAVDVKKWIPPESFLNSVGSTMKLIPAGRFLMGSPLTETDRFTNEQQHVVQITKPYYMATTEVTQAQWYAVMGTTPWRGKDYVREGNDYPVCYVDWQDADDFCRRLSQKEGRKYRLPTEAEWEYACRAGTRTTYYSGNSPQELGIYSWYSVNTKDLGNTYAHRVALKKANAFGLYDMHGNVYEWCSDWYGENYYLDSPTDDPQGPPTGTYRISRGSSYGCGADCHRSARRGYPEPTMLQDNYGFRLACTAR